MQEGIIPRPSLAERVQDMSEADIRQDYLRMLEEQEVRSLLQSKNIYSLSQLTS